MKKILASFGWILLLLPLISIAGARTAYILNTNSADERNVSGFHGISSGGSFKVYVQFGQKESVRLEGNGDILKEIETKVESGVLKIRFKNRPGYYFKNSRNDDSKINIYVTAKTLSSITASGSGDIEVQGVVKTENLQTTVSGSGAVYLNMSVRTYSAIISGSGKTTALGIARNTHITLSGSGKFEGRELKTSNSDVKVSGSGEATIFAEESLIAVVSGSGDIKYSGNAKVTATKNGSGSVSRM